MGLILRRLAGLVAVLALLAAAAPPAGAQTTEGQPGGVGELWKDYPLDDGSPSGQGGLSRPSDSARISYPDAEARGGVPWLLIAVVLVGALAAIVLLTAANRWIRMRAAPPAPSAAPRARGFAARRTR